MFILRLIGGLLDRLFIVLGAFFGSQVPAFMHQYTQRLAGHVEELDHLLSEIRRTTVLSGKPMEVYIDKFLTSNDPDFVMQGEFMQMMYMRWQHLTRVLHDLVESSMWQRPYIFFRELNFDMAKSTFSSFQPGISLTLEGLCYTGIGIFAGYILYQIAVKAVFWSFRQKKPPNPRILTNTKKSII